MSTLSNEDFQLLAQLKHYNLKYRVGEELISDAEYDLMKQDFVSRNPNHSFSILPEPNDVPEHRKESLPIPMKSLDKKKTMEQLQKWFSACGILQTEEVGLGPKWDGLSLLEDLHTSKAWTRGGEDNDGMRSDQHLIKIDGPCGYGYNIRYTGGEVIISRKNFDQYWKGQINPKTGEKYKTARGVMSGLMRNDTPSDLLQHVTYVRYYSPELEHLHSREYFKQLNVLNDVMHPQEYVKVSDVTPELLLSLYEKWNVDFDIDGIVVMITDPLRRKQLGRHSRSGNPKYAVAYKGDFEERLQTKVNGVTCKISKQAFLKPTVQLDAVILNGATIDNPTGYNMRWIFDNNVALGSQIVVKRSGEVIPKIIETKSFIPEEIKKLETFYGTCPACGAPTTWNENCVEMVCTAGKDCRGVKLAEAVSFFEIMKFEDFGEGKIEAIFNSGRETVGEILSIGSELLAIDGLGASTIETLSKQRTRLEFAGVSFASLLHASNKFVGLGSTKLQLIVDNVGEKRITDWMDIANGYCSKAEIDALSSISGLGPKTLDAFYDGWDKFLVWYYDLESYAYIKISNFETVKSIPTGTSCAGFVVCFSGIRDEDLEKSISYEGGEVKNSYSKKITHLIVADPDAATGKITKAKKDGCQILTIAQFKSL